MPPRTLNRFDLEYRDLYGKSGQPPWYDLPLNNARWKGIPFHIETTSDEFGRRGDVYEYPLGEDVGYKDLGRRAERFKVEGYLIGTNQVQLSQHLRENAMSSEPGPLEHPLFGTLTVALVTLTMTADYRRDKKRTKLAFEFVEAGRAAPMTEVGRTIGDVWSETAKAVEEAKQAAEAARLAADDSEWQAIVNPPNPQTSHIAEYQQYLSQQVGSVTPQNEQTLDAQDALAPNRWWNFQWNRPGWWPFQEPVSLQASGRFSTRNEDQVVTQPGSGPVTFASLIWPIDYASSVLREFHTDALEKLRDFNRFVVNRQEATPMAQWLVITIRLIILRDFATAAARKNYETIRDALDDLDFIVAAYDDEEAEATKRCDDVLVSLIYNARAAAVSAILANNIRRPGIAEFPVGGVWPSLVVAWKLYADARRHEQIERYNPAMLPFWMGRDVIGPAR